MRGRAGFWYAITSLAGPLSRSWTAWAGGISAKTFSRKLGIAPVA